MQNPTELTSRPFCTRAKPPCKRSMPFCTRRKTVLQTFNALLHTAQNRPANVQSLIVHDAKPPCKRSMSDCLHCKPSRKNFRGWLFMAQDCYASVQCLIVDIVKLHCLAWEFSLCIWDSFFPIMNVGIFMCKQSIFSWYFCCMLMSIWKHEGPMWIIFF